MGIDPPFRIELRYRVTLRAAGAIGGHQLGQPSATATAIKRASAHWKYLQSRKETVASPFWDIEALKEGKTASQ